MAQCVAEIDKQLPVLQPDESAYSVTVAETSLPYLRNCVKENFRITPVFTMPLARRVLVPEGVNIAGSHIPHAVSQSLPFVLVSLLILGVNRPRLPCAIMPSTTTQQSGDPIITYLIPPDGIILKLRANPSY